MFAYVPDPMAMPGDICMRMYLCIECMSVYPVYFELLLPLLLRVAAGFFELLLVTWCGVVWCGVVWCGVVHVRRLLSQLSPLQEHMLCMYL